MNVEILKEDDPFGAKIMQDGRLRVRVWMPSQKERIPAGEGKPRLHFADSDKRIELADVGGGWYEAITNYNPADRDYQVEYWSAKTNGWQGTADTMSYELSQAHPGYTRVFDPAEIKHDHAPVHWNGIKPEEQIIVEGHIGTLTKEGTLRAAIDTIPHFAAAGYTAFESMPLGKSASRQGWGYDEFLKAAIQPEYGKPQDLVDFIDTLHAHGMNFILDVIDNHVGVNGNFEDHSPELASIPGGWGNRPDMSVPEVSKFFIQKNLHWLELGADGFRQDATHTIPHADDYSPLLYKTLKSRAAEMGRTIIINAEREDNKPSELADPGDPSKSGVRADGQWADDFCHAARALLFADRPGEGYMDRGYLAPYRNDPIAILVETLTRGFALEHGQDRNRHRTQADLDQKLVPTRAVHFTNNHDQVGNLISGERIETYMARDPLGEKKMRAITELLMMNPAGVPLFWQGQEYGAKNPFYFFANWENPEHRAPLIAGRKREFEAFFNGAATHVDFPDPCAQETIKACTLDLSEAGSNNKALTHFSHLARQRKEMIIPHLGSGIKDVQVEQSASHFIVRYVFGDGAEYSQGLNVGKAPVTIKANDSNAAGSASRAFADTVLPPWEIVSAYKPARMALADTLQPNATSWTSRKPAASPPDSPKFRQ